MKMRYRLYDSAQRKWLAGYQVPDAGCDVAVTQWTRKPENAMRFPGVKSARSVARRIVANAQAEGECVVVNARGRVIQRVESEERRLKCDGGMSG